MQTFIKRKKLQIKYSIIAKNTLSNVARFIETLNTKGSSNIWKNKFFRKVKKYAQPIKYALCRHEIYALSGFSCVAIDNWIIIFKVENNQFNVYQIVLASSLY